MIKDHDFLEKIQSKTNFWTGIALAPETGGILSTSAKEGHHLLLL
jgi:hypothetical protein